MKKQYTIRGIDKDLDKVVRETAVKYGESVNKTAIRLLKQAAGLGADQKHQGPPYHDMDYLAGRMSAEEAAKMLKAVKDMRHIEPDLWK